MQLLPDLPHLAVLVATLTLNLTPGPDILYVIARGVGQGRQAALVSVFGISGGILVHTVCAAVGLAAVLASSALAYEIIRYAGAAYLCYLGVRIIRARGEGGQVENLEDKRLAAIFRQGFVTNVLNPKVGLFFLAFLPQFVDPSRGLVGARIILLGIIFNTSGTVVNLSVALLSGRLGASLQARPATFLLQRWFTGSVLIGLAARLVLAGRR